MNERERLLEAIVRTITERGYAATTVADVCAHASVAEEAFRRHFAGKEDCFLAACDAVGDVLIAHVGAAYEGAAGRSWPERIVAGLRALLELLAAESEVARMAMIDAPAFGDDARLRYRVSLERFVPFLEQGREYSRQSERLPPDTAQLAIGAATALIFDEVRAGRGPELPAILPALAFAVLMPYLGAAEAEREMERLR